MSKAHIHPGGPHVHIAAAMGVSRKRVRTWIDCYATDGQAGLEIRSSRPHTISHAVGARQKFIKPHCPGRTAR